LTCGLGGRVGPYVNNFQWTCDTAEDDCKIIVTVAPSIFHIVILYIESNYSLFMAYVVYVDHVILLSGTISDWGCNVGDCLVSTKLVVSYVCHIAMLPVGLIICRIGSDQNARWFFLGPNPVRSNHRVGSFVPSPTRVTPGLEKITECIPYVYQDQVPHAHTVDVTSEYPNQCINEIEYSSTLLHDRQS
jgi:hypothetical protein